MNGLKYFSTQEPGRRLPWMGLSEPLDFDLFAQTCAILEADAVGPLGAYLANLLRFPNLLSHAFLPRPIPPRSRCCAVHWA